MLAHEWDQAEVGKKAPLTARLRHSQTRLDTNSVENAIRPSKLGAKNGHFTGHPDAGDRAAGIYSLVISCQRHGYKQQDYLRDVFDRLPSTTTTGDLHPVLPCIGGRGRRPPRNSRIYGKSAGKSLGATTLQGGIRNDRYDGSGRNLPEPPTRRGGIARGVLSIQAGSLRRRRVVATAVRS